MSWAAVSISSARGRTRTSSVKFSQRTVPEPSTRNSAGREMKVRFALRHKLAETSGGIRRYGLLHVAAGPDGHDLVT
jgi:hypothetical protein